jgi:superfamily I DNA/RNA helicase
MALPVQWRPAPDYKISFPNDRLYRALLDELGTPPRSVGSRAEIEAINTKEFEREYLFGKRLPEKPSVHPDLGAWAAQQYWNSMLRARHGSLLTFPMISRLAELLVRVNPMVRQALTLTYSHLFLDEFQDTTHIQNDVVTTIFLGSSTIVTAIGNNKQQIMRWAMAMENPFAAFERDFTAKRTPLLNNYRSSPDLVRIQHVLAQALDEQTVEAISQTPGTVSGDSCQIWDFLS